MPNFEVRNRLRIAHEHAAAAVQRAAMVHEEAASYWEQIHELEHAEEHRRAAARCVDMAKYHEAQALEFAQPRQRRDTAIGGPASATS